MRSKKKEMSTSNLLLSIYSTFTLKNSLFPFMLGHHSVSETLILLPNNFIHYYYTSFTWKYLVQRFWNGLQSTRDNNNTS